MVGVIGPDGVGKSTLLALIAGVRTIQQGEIVVFDGNVANKEHLREIRGRIAYMPQGLGRNLYPTLSVFENIDFFGRLFGQGAEGATGAHHRTSDRDRHGEVRGSVPRASSRAA